MQGYHKKVTINKPINMNQENQIWAFWGRGGGKSTE